MSHDTSTLASTNNSESTSTSTSTSTSISTSASTSQSTLFDTPPTSIHRMPPVNRPTSTPSLRHNPFQSPPTPTHHITSPSPSPTYDNSDYILFNESPKHEKIPVHGYHHHHHHTTSSPPNLMSLDDDDNDDGSEHMFDRMTITSIGQTTRTLKQAQKATSTSTSTSKSTSTTSKSSSQSSSTSSTSASSSSQPSSITPTAPPLSPALLQAIAHPPRPSLPPTTRLADIIQREVVAKLHPHHHIHDDGIPQSQRDQNDVPPAPPLDEMMVTTLYGRAPPSRPISRSSSRTLHRPSTPNIISSPHMDMDPLDECIAAADVDVDVDVKQEEKHKIWKKHSSMPNLTVNDRSTSSDSVTTSSISKISPPSRDVHSSTATSTKISSLSHDIHAHSAHTLIMPTPEEEAEYTSPSTRDTHISPSHTRTNSASMFGDHVRIHIRPSIQPSSSHDHDLNHTDDDENVAAISMDDTSSSQQQQQEQQQQQQQQPSISVFRHPWRAFQRMKKNDDDNDTGYTCLPCMNDITHHPQHHASSSQLPLTLSVADISRVAHERRMAARDKFMAKLKPAAPIAVSKQDSVQFLKLIGASLFSVGLPMHVVEFYCVLIAHRLDINLHVVSINTTMWMTFDSDTTCHLVVPPRAGLSLSKMVDTTHIAEDILCGRGSPHEGLAELSLIIERPMIWARYSTIPAQALMGALCAPLFGAARWEILVAGFVAGIMACVEMIGERHTAVHRGHEIISGAMSSLCAVIFHLYISELNVLAAIFGGIIWSLPGLRMTTAVIDLSTGNSVTGTGKFVSALFTAINLGIGVTFGIQIHQFITGTSNFVHSIPEPEEWIVYLCVAGASIPTLTLLDGKPSHFPQLLFSSLVTFTAASYGTLYLGTGFGTWMAAFIAGSMSNLYGRLTKNPGIEMYLFSIIMLVPGSLGVRSVLAATTVDSISAVTKAITVAVALATGLFAANLIVPPERNM